MQTKKLSLSNASGSSNLIYCAAAGAFAAVLLLILQALTDQWFFSPQPYNSYILQAQSWLEGRLDLGQNYEYLELAVYNGKYFVSFPPFPSYIMLPFVALGLLSCDGAIAFVSAVLGAVFAYRLAAEFIKDKKFALMAALLVTAGSNWLFTSANAWVWFIAQNLAFTLTVSSLFYAVRGRAGVSFTLWVCAVGCRPFQIIYIAVILFLLYSAYKARQPHMTAAEMIRAHISAVIPACCIAISYMALNYARFGSIIEFGHNYLPEFMRVDTGQFNIEYIKQNFGNLFRLPEISDGKIVFQSADGFCMFIASPVLISFFAYWFGAMIHGTKEERLALAGVMLLFWIHMVSITAHKTMGGSHYGNRYVTDALPSVFAALCFMIGKYKRGRIINAVPLACGMALNIYWVLIYF